MADPLDALILDLLESIAPHPKLYSDVMSAWRTSCPRLPVWEEANARGFIERRSEEGGGLVCLTPVGRDHLLQHRGPKSQRENIDWNALANRLGAFGDPNPEGSGSDMARAALEEIVGPEILRAAVDYYVSRAPGAELARSVLWQIHPWSAMQRCHELFLTSPDLETRRSAIELLRVVADKRALPWISDYLADPDPRIQFWGAGIIDQLLYSGQIEIEDCESLLQALAAHSNPKLREQYEALMDVVSANGTA